MKVLMNILIVIGGIGIIPTVSTQAAGFTVTPMIQEVILEADEAAEAYQVSIANTTANTVTFELSVLDFGSLDESGGVAFLGATELLEERYTTASWMALEMNTITLAPGEERALSVQIVNQDSLAPGGHYGALVFKTLSLPLDTAHVAVRQIIASLVLVKKTSGAIYGLELVSVEQDSSGFLFDRFPQVKFKNTGNVHVVPRGEWRVQDMFGRLVYRGVLNETSAVLLPEIEKGYGLSLVPAQRAFFPGYYEVTFHYRYDGHGEMTLWTSRFFFFPPLALLCIFTIFILGGIGFLLRFRSRKALV